MVLHSSSAGRAAYPARLIESGLLSLNDLSVAEQHAAREHLTLADALVALSLVSEGDAFSLLAKAAEVPFMSLDGVRSSELAIRLVPERTARRHRAVPLRVDNRTLTYGTANPFDPEAQQDLAFASGRRALPVVCTASEILEALDRCYPRRRQLDVLAEQILAERPAVENDADDQRAQTTSAVIDLCNHIVGRAVDMGASDIHFDCGLAGTTVRYRICGVLEQVLSLPAEASQPIRNRFKILSRTDIAIRNRPQDGAFRIKVNGRPIDVRLSTLPTIDGEKMVLRVIDSISPLQSLERLGYDEATLTRFRRSLARSDGLVLVTGPTGCGKTTVLYAALNHLRTGHINIVSVEDPVERAIAGVTQIPVNAKAGNTFPTVLRSLLRQDPNIIMVGEIRDGEVAQIVGQAAYTGHLVLSSLHTTDTATAILRLQHLGLEPYKIAESLSAVLAQRLIRSLCPHCKQQRDEIVPTSRGMQRRGARRTFVAGPGCEYCKHTGYAGRVPVAELLTPSDQLRNALSRGATAHEIRAAMRGAGFPALQDQALKLVESGVTSMDEVSRVLSTDEVVAATQAVFRRLRAAAA